MSDEEEEFKEELPSLGVYEGERNEVGSVMEKERIRSPMVMCLRDYMHSANATEAEFTSGKNGAKYVGEYKNSVRDGAGTLYYPDGSKYRGEVKSKVSGTAPTVFYYYPNGDTYHGDWRNDLKNGKGTYLYKCGSKKVGLWVDGSLIGAGEIAHADHKIVGSWNGNSLMNLPSKIVFANGHVQSIQDQSFFVTPPKIEV
ncbi:hypothetical protein BC829DRAFT_414501 [Chytridium lagenaria]|nr:hypothetical protein BC829DRAFT_414501 [Chytridium lagenaria]